MLIANAEIDGRAPVDLRIVGGHVAEIGALVPQDGEEILDARGGALLPGLHDHHIHLFALAARQASVFCGPPEVNDLAALCQQLAQPGDGWLRGLGYHESVAGLLDAVMLDRIVPHRPLRIQHRSGRMWFLNSAALSELLARSPAPPGLERGAQGYTGRLFDEDKWLRDALGGQMPDLTAISHQLARFGITGVTDMSPDNGPAVARYLTEAQSRGALLQSIHLAGVLALGEEPLGTERLRIGPVKIHLHEAALPPHDLLIDTIRRAHAQNRNIAVHCTTEVELVFTLSAIEEAGSLRGDRIEHASVASDELVEEIARLGLSIVTQPNFVRERGDSYRADLPPEDWPSLYRLRSLLASSIPLAAGSDAPFGLPDPWAVMAAAVDRRTLSNAILGAEEALSPEEALALFLSEPIDLTRQRRIVPGVAADLCLLKRGWHAARSVLSAALVRATFIGGSFVYNCVDQTPAERCSGGDTFA